MPDNRVITRGLSLLTVIFVFLSIGIPAVNADILYLKNGHSIEGLIKNADDNSVELEVYAGTVKFRRSEIEKIEKTAPEESYTIRQKWERKKIENQKEMLKRQLEEEQRPKKIHFSEDSQSIILEATLNKRIKVSLMLDTGSSLVVLKKDVAKALGVNLDKVKTSLQLTLADGRKINAKHVTLESIRVENTEANNVDAAIMLDEAGDLGFGDGLLGMSFLKRFNFKVDQKDKKLTLEKL